jgi:hypothetical protein
MSWYVVIRGSIMKRLRLRVLLSVLLIAFVAIRFSSIVIASSSEIKPGSASQVKAAVAASILIEKAPKDLTPSIQSAPWDSWSSAYPIMKHGCTDLNQCVFGDTTSTKSIIVFGDSHAAMWLPALTPFALKDHYKIIVLITLGCPAADISIDDTRTYQKDMSCDAERSADIGLINGYKPNYVVIANKTSGVVSNATSTYTTNSQWQTAMEETLTLLEPSEAKIAIVSDINAFVTSPSECLASYRNVQECSVANPETNPAEQGHQPAEHAAAEAKGADYINTSPWLCTSTKCSPIIGRFLAYADSNHINVIYSAYLSTVMGKELEAFTK